MDLGSLRALVLEVNLDTHGVDVVVTRPAPECTPIETKGIWLTNEQEDRPGPLDLQRRDVRRVMALSRADVPTVPRGTFIVAPEKAGDTPERWRLDGPERFDADKVHVVLIRDPDPSDA